MLWYFILVFLLANVKSKMSFCGPNAQWYIRCYNLYNKYCMRCNCISGYAALRGRCVLEATARQETSGELQRYTHANFIVIMGQNCGKNMAQFNKNCKWGTWYSFCYCVNGYHRYEDECISDT
ncbi:unnamed protein product [Dracunculus medinensis]|uniref:Venom protein n=1 Tax=Dracunculus medinensis TaxID=318479 RepID=A0A0N4UR34_DRAME|nr:unnamed protein product [Dracunculus medinensis]